MTWKRECRDWPACQWTDEVCAECWPVDMDVPIGITLTEDEQKRRQEAQEAAGKGDAS